MALGIDILYLLSTKVINLLALPPSLPNVLLIPCPARLSPDPADEVTLESPREACDVALLAVSFAFEVVSEAMSVAFAVVEACRRAGRRAMRCAGRRRRRRPAVVAGIVTVLPANQSIDSRYFAEKRSVKCGVRMELWYLRFGRLRKLAKSVLIGRKFLGGEELGSEATFALNIYSYSTHYKSFIAIHVVLLNV